jgi:hypothetical protein
MTKKVTHERIELSDDEQLLYERLKAATDEHLRMAKLLPVTSSKDLFGKTEYESRDRVHELGAKALEIAAGKR